MDAEAGTSPAAPDFLIARGGPFYELQERLGLIHAQALRAGQRALLAVALAWGVPLVLAALAGTAWSGTAAERPYLLDLGAWARFFVAVGMLVLAERQVEERLRALQAQFQRTPLLPPGSRTEAARVLVRALRRRDSRLAELAILVLAVLLTATGAQAKLDADPSLWLARTAADGTHRVTMAGW